jgi:hypothetical protein
MKIKSASDILTAEQKIALLSHAHATHSPKCRALVHLERAAVAAHSALREIEACDPGGKDNAIFALLAGANDGAALGLAIEIVNDSLDASKVVGEN